MYVYLISISAKSLTVSIYGIVYILDPVASFLHCMCSNTSIRAVLDYRTLRNRSTSHHELSWTKKSLWKTRRVGQSTFAASDKSGLTQGKQALQRTLPLH